MENTTLHLMVKYISERTIHSYGAVWYALDYIFRNKPEGFSMLVFSWDYLAHNLYNFFAAMQTYHLYAQAPYREAKIIAVNNLYRDLEYGKTFNNGPSSGREQGPKNKA